MNARQARALAALALLDVTEANPTRRGWRECARALGRALREEMAANVARPAMPANDSRRTRKGVLVDA